MGKRKSKGKDVWVPYQFDQKCQCGNMGTMRETDMCGTCSLGEADAHYDMLKDGGYYVGTP